RRGVSDQGIEEGALEIKIEFTYRGEDRTDIRNHYRQLWAWLRNRGQLGELIFDEEPDKSYYARVIGMTELEEFIHISKGELTFFIPDPDALGKVSEKRIAGLGIGHVDSTREDFMKGILTNLTTERINGDDDLVLEKYGTLFLDNAEWDDGTYEDMMKTSEELTLYRGTGAHKSISATEEWNDSEQSENTIGVYGNLVLDNIPEYFMQ